MPPASDAIKVWSVARYARQDRIFTVAFVYVRPISARERAIYDDAVNVVCGARSQEATRVSLPST
jgi:hypothetical protein